MENFFTEQEHNKEKKDLLSERERSLILRFYFILLDNENV